MEINDLECITNAFGGLSARMRKRVIYINKEILSAYIDNRLRRWEYQKTLPIPAISETKCLLYRTKRGGDPVSDSTTPIVLPQYLDRNSLNIELPKTPYTLCNPIRCFAGKDTPRYKR